MDNLGEKRSEYDFFVLYPANPSLAQYLQNISAGHFVRTSDEPEGSIWGTYKLASVKETPTAEYDEKTKWTHVKDAYYAKLKSHKEASKSGLGKPLYAPDFPPWYVRQSPSFSPRSGLRASVSLPNTPSAHAHSHVLFTNNSAEYPTQYDVIFALKNPLATGLKQMISSFESQDVNSGDSCEYNRLSEDVEANTKPGTPAEDTTMNHKSDLKSSVIAKETQLRTNPLRFDYGPPAFVATMASQQSDPTTANSRNAKGSVNFNYPSAKESTLDKNSLKLCDTGEHPLLTEPGDNPPRENVGRGQVEENCARPSSSEGSFGQYLLRKSSRKTSSPVMNISTSSLNSSQDIQNSSVYSLLTEDEG